MDKQIGVYLSKEIPLINKKEWTTDTQNNMNVSPKHPLERKKPNKNRHILWAHKNERKQIYGDTSQKVEGTDEKEV